MTTSKLDAASVPKNLAASKKTSYSRIYGVSARSSHGKSLIFVCQIDNFQQSVGTHDRENGSADRFLRMVQHREKEGGKLKIHDRLSRQGSFLPTNLPTDQERVALTSGTKGLNAAPSTPSPTTDILAA